MAAVTRREYVGGAAETELSSDITNASTSITVDDATGWPTGTNPFFIVIDEGNTSEEKILCSSRSGNTLTVSSRGEDDTSASSHDAGASVKHVWTAQDADDANKVAAALTTKGDLLGFGTEPTRVPVGADDTFPVADSSDAEGVAYKNLHDIIGTLEVDGSTEVASYTVTESYADAASVSLTIPAGWGSWKCFASASYVLENTDATDQSNVGVRLSIDGTAQQALEGLSIGTDDAVPGGVVGRRTGMSTTGSRTISLQAKIQTVDGPSAALKDVHLYARAVRTG